MRSFALNCSPFLIVLVGVTLTIPVTGCGTGSTPPGARTMYTSAPGMNIVYLQWKEGLTVLFVDDSQSKTMEFHPGLEKRVGSDCDFRLTRREFSNRLATRCGGHASGQ